MSPLIKQLMDARWKRILLPMLVLGLPAAAAMRVTNDDTTSFGETVLDSPLTVTSSSTPRLVSAHPTTAVARKKVKPVSGLVFPVAAHDVGSVVGHFGDSRDGGRRSHLGIDIAAPRGTPVVAVSEGTIESVGYERLGGRIVWLRERGSARRHYFAHLQTISVARGQKVDAGDVIGTVGTTGNAAGTPPHLHYAVRLANDILDPMSLFKYVGAATKTNVKSVAGRTMHTHLRGGALKSSPGHDAMTVAVLPDNATVTVLGSASGYYR
ncbi:MAG: M23 family metallopeptidase, partial [Longimicrobiales bacterium]